ncbi:MAG: hypothetical protein VSS75_021770 [Candidatus Parabeggiatoa sp.]|nr:hypothetical protein [Candidatus Parabeggiatoa sp.]
MPRVSTQNIKNGLKITHLRLIKGPQSKITIKLKKTDISIY